MARRNLPPLAAIRVFEAAARNRNFTSAASELGMTQAAVSYQIKVLEDRIGAPLFKRHARGVIPTEVGEKFAARTREALDVLSDAYSDAQGRSQETLAISVIPTFATNMLARRLGTFQQENPSIAVRVEVSETLTDFSQDTFDIAIRVGRGDWEGMRSHLIVPTNFTPMLNRNLAESIGGLNTPADLLKLPILSKSDPWWRIWLEAAGVPADAIPDTQVQQFGPQVLEAQAAIAGQGVGMLTPAFYRDAVENDQLFQPFDLVCDDGTGCWLVYPESRRNAPKIKVFRKWLEREFSDLRSA